MRACVYSGLNLRSYFPEAFIGSHSSIFSNRPAESRTSSFSMSISCCFGGADSWANNPDKLITRVIIIKLVYLIIVNCLYILRYTKTLHDCFLSLLIAREITVFRKKNNEGISFIIEKTVQLCVIQVDRYHCKMIIFPAAKTPMHATNSNYSRFN